MMLVALFVCALGYGSYSAYDYATMTDAERFLLANIEALAIEEPGGGNRGDREDYYNKTESYREYSASADANIREQGFSVDWSSDVIVILNYCKWDRNRHCYSQDTGVKYSKK